MTILKTLINDGARLVVLGKNERLADLAQLKSKSSSQPVWDDSRLFDYSPALKLMVVPEESLLRLPNDPIGGAGPIVRVLARAAYIITAHRPQDPEWGRRPSHLIQQYEKRVERLDDRFGAEVETLFQAASKDGLWRGTPASADAISYWSAGVEAYFDAAGPVDPPLQADSPVTTRERLKAYDPRLFELVERIFAYRGHIDWRADVGCPVK